jgi:hypothetical protein
MTSRRLPPALEIYIPVPWSKRPLVISAYTSLAILSIVSAPALITLTWLIIKLVS